VLQQKRDRKQPTSEIAPTSEKNPSRWRWWWLVYVQRRRKCCNGYDIITTAIIMYKWVWISLVFAPQKQRKKRAGIQIQTSQ
jgi:hypothetical protein